MEGITPDIRVTILVFPERKFDMQRAPQMTTSPHQAIMQMVSGKCVSRCIEGQSAILSGPAKVMNSPPALRIHMGPSV
jgi:hypothetical protein